MKQRAGMFSILTVFQDFFLWNTGMNSKNRMKKIACRPERRNVKVLFMMR